jgi:hypothetical protein
VSKRNKSFQTKEWNWNVMPFDNLTYRLEFSVSSEISGPISKLNHAGYYHGKVKEIFLRNVKFWTQRNLKSFLWSRHRMQLCGISRLYLKPLFWHTDVNVPIWNSVLSLIHQNAICLFIGEQMSISGFTKLRQWTPQLVISKQRVWR